ncbi:serine/threonine-protein kinase H1-like [Lytechinus variegatus]|uniref:serine/threonine-protein kinase H1-like n=1 Tax=Lytechinus variegatus TaxID=7654 RepID=UPI001BB20F54|nr:serine/threonine-protein kinase H1-like [Lytechinus variegatus]
MGCGSGKLAPDSPIIDKHIDWVKTVETGGVPSYAGNNAANKGNQYNRVNNGDNRGQTRRAKWKVKFDPRVNAKYDIKALIGTGTYSRVVRVEHRSTRQPYAIKMVEKKRDGKQFWEVELTILRRVRHSNIIQLLEVYDGKDRIYMIMELATGGELFDRIVTRGNFTERDATRVLHMVLDAMRYLHGLGITHRDLKPENLLYYHPGNESKIMITDFGLASFRKNAEGPENNMMRTICGTPEYISPEILLRKPYTQSVDLWAIGVVAYILLSGRMPFDDDNRTRLYRKILRAKYSFTGDPWKDVSPAGKDFIDKLLVINPSERMTASQAMKHPWIVTMAAQSSLKNLQRSISQNWLKHTSTRSRSARSTRSNHSNKSSKSLRSNRGQRVKAKDLDKLAKEIKKETKTSDVKSGRTSSLPDKTTKALSLQPLPDINHHPTTSRDDPSSSRNNLPPLKNDQSSSRNGLSKEDQSLSRNDQSSRNDKTVLSSKNDHGSRDGSRDGQVILSSRTERSLQNSKTVASSKVDQTVVTLRNGQPSLMSSEDDPLSKVSSDHHLTRPSVLPPLNSQKTSSSSLSR